MPWCLTKMEKAVSEVEVPCTYSSSFSVMNGCLQGFLRKRFQDCLHTCFRSQSVVNIFFKSVAKVRGWRAFYYQLNSNSNVVLIFESQASSLKLLKESW